MSLNPSGCALLFSDAVEVADCSFQMRSAYKYVRLLYTSVTLMRAFLHSCLLASCWHVSYLPVTLVLPHCQVAEGVCVLTVMALA